MMTYFEYVLEKVGAEKASEHALCKVLHDILINPEDTDLIDETRYDDVDEMRVNYLDFVGRDSLFEDEIDELLTNLPSMLELLVVLSVKIEDKVMSNPIYGDRTAKWFWTMIENLDISPENVYSYEGGVDANYVRNVCDRWLSGNYDRKGVGSPFPLKKPHCDVRVLSIWEHAMAYFNENFEGRW